MSTQVIIFCGLAAIAIPLGSFVAIKTIKKLTGTPTNLLRGHHQDIELIQSGFNPRDVDLGSIPEYPSSHGLINQFPIRWDIYQGNSWRIPSYRSETLPSYNSYDNININCVLENDININFIWGLIFIIITLIIYYFLFIVKRNNENKIVFTEGISTNVITFTQDYQDLLSSNITDGINYGIIYDKTYYHTMSHFWSVFDIKDWLDSLNEQDYAVTFQLTSVPSQELYYNNPITILSNEFIINKSSKPALISTLLYQQLEYFSDIFNFFFKYLVMTIIFLI